MEGGDKNSNNKATDNITRIMAFTLGYDHSRHGYINMKGLDIKMED